LRSKVRGQGHGETKYGQKALYLGNFEGYGFKGKGITNNFSGEGLPVDVWPSMINLFYPK